MKMPDNVKECIHCNRCIKKCSFLTKYNMDLEEFSKRGYLAYHCFLCNDCKIVCPKNIDGSNISLALRHSKVEASENNKKEIEKKYKALLFEKKDYIFKNYNNIISESVIFPGCNFSSFYPDALKYILRKFKKEYNIGVVFDCCGKPIAELGIEEYEANIIKKLEENMLSKGVKEIITLCPNCYYFLKPRINIKIITIYEKMNELGLKFNLNHLNKKEEINLFVPCPDKETKYIRDCILKIIDLNKDKIKEINDINCCGLGGCAISNERELAEGFIDKLKKKNINELYVYCATCAGNFNRHNIKNIHHILLDMFNMDNLKNKTSLLNRALFRFFKL